MRNEIRKICNQLIRFDHHVMTAPLTAKQSIKKLRALHKPYLILYNKNQDQFVLVLNHKNKQYILNLDKKNPVASLNKYLKCHQEEINKIKHYLNELLRKYYNRVIHKMDAVLIFLNKHLCPRDESNNALGKWEFDNARKLVYFKGHHPNFTYMYSDRLDVDHLYKAYSAILGESRKSKLSKMANILGVYYKLDMLTHNQLTTEDSYHFNLQNKLAIKFLYKLSFAKNRNLYRREGLKRDVSNQGNASVTKHGMYRSAKKDKQQHKENKKSLKIM